MRLTVWILANMVKQVTHSEEVVSIELGVREKNQKPKCFAYRGKKDRNLGYYFGLSLQTPN
jgi:hypothetical protein